MVKSKNKYFFRQSFTEYIVLICEHRIVLLLFINKWIKGNKKYDK